QGPQVDFHSLGKYRINTYLFRVMLDTALTIPSGSVGVVTARDGEPMTPGRLLARRVEGHYGFQNGEAFLNSGGQRGPQIEVLLPGRDRLNTALFSVAVKPGTVVPGTHVG